MDYLTFLKNLRTRREMEPSIISDEFLVDLINYVRYASSARNEQILRFALFNDISKVNSILEQTNLMKSHGITLKNRPSAFIAIGTTTKIPPSTVLGADIGIAVQIIREAIYLKGYDSVCIFSFNKKAIQTLLKSEFYPECLIALGKSSQKINIVSSNQAVGYYRDKDNIHTVNKLELEKLIVK